MDEATPLTPFDTMTQTREIQMLKTVIPYMKSSQKKQFAILIKYMELQNTLHIFSQEEQVLSMCSLPEEENNPQSLLNSLRPFCTPKELETIDMLTNMLSMLETYETKGFSMENDVFKTNPVFQNLSPEKLSFLMNFANSKKPTEMKDMMPFLLGTLSSAKKQNIQFTKPETELMISILKQSMSPEEAEKADKIIRLMKERSGQSQ